jgi:hypothetical protein
MPETGTPPLRTCCLVSEMLEEAGLDRVKARALRRQILEGLILLCRWQIERMDEAPPAPRDPKRRRQKVPVE